MKETTSSARTSEASAAWLDALQESARSHRRMIDAIVGQLTDEELFQRPAAEVNSVAIILRHLGGNLASRWTDFQTTDGEKPTRDRDQEFADWEGDRNSLLAYFDQGWQKLLAALDESETLDPQLPIYIRGDAQTLAGALVRSLTHISYHVGQIAIVARSVHQGPWQWLTIAPGASQQHNDKTWGSSESRAIFADKPAEEE